MCSCHVFCSCLVLCMLVSKLMCWCCMSVHYAAIYVCAACLCFMPLYMCFYYRCVCPVLIYCFVHFPTMFDAHCVLFGCLFHCLFAIVFQLNLTMCYCIFLVTFVVFNLCLYNHFISVILGCLLNILKGTTYVN